MAIEKNSIRGIRMQKVTSDIRGQTRTKQGEGDLRHGKENTVERNERRGLSGRLTVVYRTYGRV